MSTALPLKVVLLKQGKISWEMIKPQERSWGSLFQSGLCPVGVPSGEIGDLGYDAFSLSHWLAAPAST